MIRIPLKCTSVCIIFPVKTPTILNTASIRKGAGCLWNPIHCCFPIWGLAATTLQSGVSMNTAFYPPMSCNTSFIFSSILEKAAGFSFIAHCCHYHHCRYIQRKRQAKKRLEDLRNSIARDLHDEMGSTLSQINMMSELLAIKSKDQNYATINQKIKEVMSTMSEIVWSINPQKDSLRETISKIQEFAIEILESKGIDLHFTISPGLEENYHPIKDDTSISF